MTERKEVRHGAEGLRCPPAVAWIARTLEEAGFETWAVGGAVRDALQGVESVDWDFATRARPRDVRRLFRRTVPVGVEHGTVGVLARDGTMHEVTTFRRDVETFGRKAVVEFADDIDDDLARRDFTINAIAWHPLREELYDPFHGLGDLESGTLRTVGAPGERFSEDYLRILRALRFAGRFELTIEEATWGALTASVDQLVQLSRERVREELFKVLSMDPRPSRALSLYGAAGVLDVLYPELAALRDVQPTVPLSPRDVEALAGGTGANAWSCALLTAEEVTLARPVLRLAALLLDVGIPPRVPGQAEPTAPDVGEGPGAPDGPIEGEAAVRSRGAERAAAVLTRIRCSNAEIGTVAGLVRVGPRLPSAEADGTDRRRWLASLEGVSASDIIRVAAARARVGCRGGDEEAPRGVAAAARALREERRREPCVSVGQLAVNGTDLKRLGMKPGPRFGEILQGLLERVIEDPTLNDPRTLEQIVREEFPDDQEESRE